MTENDEKSAFFFTCANRLRRLLCIFATQIPKARQNLLNIYHHAGKQKRSYPIQNHRQLSSQPLPPLDTRRPGWCVQQRALRQGLGMSAIPKKTRRKPEGKDSPSDPSAVPTGKQDFCTIARCGKKAENLLFLFHANQQLTFCKFIVKTSYIIVSQCFTKYITCRWNCFCLIDEWQL